MKVRILRSYKDVSLERAVGRGEILDVTAERGKYLIEHPAKLAEEIGNTEVFDTTPPLKVEPVEVEAPTAEAPEVKEDVKEDIKEVTPKATKRRYKGAKK